MPPLWLAGLFVLSLLELLAFGRRPLLLAPLAFLPLGKRRRITVAPEVRGALTVAGEHVGGYRDPAAQRLQIAHLPIAPTFEGPGYSAVVSPRRRLAVVRLSSSGRPLGLAAIELWTEGDVVELRARYTPVPLLGILSLIVVLWLAAGRALWPSAFAAALLAAVLVVLPLAVRGRMRRAVDATMDQIERALTHAPS